MMGNRLIVLRFVGSAYHGSQIQKNANTIQAEFQQALGTILGELPDIKCCSRTDAGVHANRFYISFYCNEDAPPPERLAAALNNHLPRDIRVVDSAAVADSFHARYSATGKRYIYKIWNAPVMDPFYLGRAVHFPKPIDVPALDAVAQVFTGRHDFRAFCAKKGAAGDTARTVTQCRVSRDGALVLLSITADGFLYNMARAIAGTLLGAARGRITRADIATRLDGGTRDNLIITAPAEGLYLDEVFYEQAGNGRGQESGSLI